MYLYFKNKNALLLAVVGKFYERLTKSAEEGVKDIQDSYERLEFLARHHLVSCLGEWRMTWSNTRSYDTKSPTCRQKPMPWKRTSTRSAGW